MGIGVINRKSEEYTGKVYCIEVPGTHTFFIRQGGKIWLSGNSWVKKLWIDRNFEGERYDPAKFFFAPATAYDNKYIAESYIDSLKSLPEALRRAYLDGDWTCFEGQFFTSFNPKVHVIEPFEIPKEWNRYRGIDYGYVAPSAVLCICLVSLADSCGRRVS